MILIDMNMPKCCGDCTIGFCKQIGCENYIGYDDYKNNRHPNCPLKEQKTGKWIEKEWVDDEGEGCYEYACSECEASAPWFNPYCHECGAKMIGVVYSESEEDKNADSN